MGGRPREREGINADWIQISCHGGDGTIQEAWARIDLAKMMAQVGAMPAPEGM